MGVWDYLEDPNQFLPLIAHPANVETAQVVEKLVTSLRAAPDVFALRDLQVDLINALVEVETLYRRATRAYKRTGGDPFDQRLWRRAMVQLRSVGDAIVWHFFDCRRQWILLLGANQHPGIMSDKLGFQDELAAFERHWDAGEATILTGATNCITATDLLAARDGILSAYEIKRSPAGKRPDQTAKLADLVQRVNEDPRIDFPDGPSWMLQSDVPLVSHWSGAEPHIQRALAQGVATWVPTPGIAVMFWAGAKLTSLGQDKGAAVLEAEQASAARQVGYGEHRILFNSKDLPYRTTAIAPMTILPVSPSSAAALVTNQVLFVVEVYLGRIIDELRAAGAEPINLLASTPPGKAPKTILRWVRRDGLKLSMNTTALQQVAYELNDPAVWVRAFVSAPLPAAPPRRWHSYVCLANESAVWA